MRTVSTPHRLAGLKSPTASPLGPTPAAKSLRGSNVPSSFPSKTDTVPGKHGPLALWQF